MPQLGGGGSVLRRVAGQFADDEFLQDIVSRRSADADERVFKRYGHIAVALGIVKVGDAAGGKAAEDRGVIGLPVSIIAFANHGVGKRIEETPVPRSGPFV